MAVQDVEQLSLNTIIALCEDLARGRPVDEEKLLLFTEAGRVPEIYCRLAEAFGLMSMKVESQNAESARLIAELRTRNAELEAARKELLERNTLLLHSVQDVYQMKHVVARCPAMRRVVSLTMSIARRPINTLVFGPTGSGKEVVAKLIHNNSPRRDGPFVIVNCTAIPDSLFESEMFGSEKGVATGGEPRKGLVEEAGGGTLFLDELEEMSLTNQARLLRVLEERSLVRVGSSKSIPVDIKIIAATHVPLAEAVRLGKFREDLYYHINVAEIQLPYLRERGDDILLLAQTFLERHCARLKRPRLCLSREARDVLKRYDWPGNVRELNNEMERAAALSPGKQVEAADLSPRLQPAGSYAAPGRGMALAGSFRADNRLSAPQPLPKSVLTPQDAETFDLDTLEKAAIERALAHTGGNRSRAAALLGLTREGLRKKLLRMSGGD